ncbi:hypothetical protein PHMEG_00013502 [Phytophthora megakarya]|uniref:Uncharacterized protein n=1 Tax=Phytophthora megakarya TaxID=4795 RepID=A0A225W644_9STRA|nr:hypothetical protein PHMEG_00013502 [Phytophthora megakarya]
MKQAKGAAHTEIDIAAKKPLTATECEVAAVDMGELLVTNSSMDAERVHLVHCINFVTFALMNAENRKENVPGLKHTLTTELTHYVKRLKRIQDDDN